ncbi:MAG: hypothetical protein V3V08_10595 [Nannocystaceae bacterium]
MPYELYKVVHVLGIAMVCVGIGATAVAALLAQNQHPGLPPLKKLSAITHGVGLLLILVSGFGILAKLHLSFTSPWLVLKLVVWLLLGVAPVVWRRVPQSATIMWWAVPALVALAGYLGLSKPMF